MPTTTRSIPQDLLDGLHTSNDVAIERGFRELYPSLLAEATAQLTDHPTAAPLIVEKAFLKVVGAASSIGSMPALDTALHAAIHDAVVRDRSRRAAVHRFEHNEGVATSHGAAPVGAAPMATVDQVWSRIQHSRDAMRHPSKGSGPDGHLAATHMVGAIDRRNRWTIPIVILAVVVVSIGVYAVTKADNTPRESDVMTAIMAADGQTLTAGDGQIGHISLADETTTTLGSGSKLRVPRSLDTWRAVGLNGAASFTVPAGKRNFEVRGNHIAVSMPSGTMDIAADSQAPVTVVRIRTGSARVKLGDSSWNATAGQALAIENGKIREASLDDLSDAFSWISGRFSARGKVSDIVLKMSHWYGSEVAIGDASIANREGIAAGSLDSLRATVATLEKSAKLKLSGVNGKWILFPNGK
jgi:ferric-dicitrate binding protein FerR (iron transport regulator)